VLARRLRYFHVMPAIRLADAADHAPIVALVHEAYAVYLPRIGRPPAPMLEDYGALIAEGRIHVLEDETGIAGIVVLIPEAHAMLLDNVAVKVAAQGRGYGTPSSLSPRRQRGLLTTRRSASLPMSA
jgi:hypothetical protein